MSTPMGLRSERGPILLAVMLSIFLIAIDSTILATAVPTIVRELGGFEQFPWLFSIYLLGQAATAPVYGKLADTFGRKPIMMTGIVVFLVGSVLCATAWDMTSLILFRAVQGLGAGAIMPTAFTITSDIYTLRERARAQGYLSSVWAVAAVAGPLCGGLFAQFVSWRWIFWVNVPVGLLALVLLWRTYHERFERHPRRIDYAGSLLLTTALVLLVLGVLEGGHAWAWVSWQSLAVFGGGVALLVAFVLVERRASDPVLAPWLLRSRIVVTSSLASMGVGIVLIGAVSYIPAFLETSANATPVAAGLALAPLMIGWSFTSTMSGRFYLRHGFRATAVTGSILAIVGTAAVAGFALTPSVVLTALGCLGVGLGLGFVAAPTLIAAQSSVEARRRGVVSSTNALTRSIGSSLGVAVFGAVANAVIATHGGESADAVHAGAIAVFLAVAIAAVLLLVVSLTVPHVELEPDRA